MSPRIAFAGGGTAGHLAPGFAMADQLEVRGASTFFLTPGMREEATWFAGRAAPLVSPADRLPRSLRGVPGFMLRLPGHTRRAKRALRDQQATALVALGGWPCFPALRAARSLGLPIVFLVPDETPGKVVARFAHWALRHYVAGAAAAAKLGERALVVGPLLRTQALTGSRDVRRFGLSPDRRTVLVTGGSLGAEALDAWVLGALERLSVARRGELENMQFLHAAGPRAAALAARYEALRLPAHVTPYIADIGDAYASADLFVGRAGAGTCAELEAWRLPAVLVPYPGHADRQQFANAEPLRVAGLAVVLEQDHLDDAAFEREVLARLASLPARTDEHRPAPVGGPALAAEDLLASLSAWRR